MATDVKEFTVFGLRMWQQVLICLVLGIIAGFVMHEDAAIFKIFGTIFIHLIKMVVVPLVFLALVSGITSMGDSANFKRVGVKGVLSYLGTALFAVIIGLAAGTIFQPGIGLHVNITEFAGAAASTATAATPMTVEDFLLDLISTNIFKMIEDIVRLAPLAVFGFLAWSIGTQGAEVIQILFNLVVAVLVACIVQYLLFGALIALTTGLNPFIFYRKLVTTQLMAFSTSSSKATLTTAMREMETKLGVSSQSTQFLLPLGACINMDGTAIYLGICALFFAQFFGVTLGTADYAMLLLTCTLGSIGAAGIPSGSIIFMGMVLHSVGLPIEGIGLLLGVDRILDMVRTTINITGDCAITLMIDASEKKLNKEEYYR